MPEGSDIFFAFTQFFQEQKRDLQTSKTYNHDNTRSPGGAPVPVNSEELDKAGKHARLDFEAGFVDHHLLQLEERVNVVEIASGLKRSVSEPQQ